VIRPIAALVLLGLLTCAPVGGPPAEQAVVRRFARIAAGDVGRGGERPAAGDLARTLPRGALIDAKTGRSITSRSTTPGETLTATVYVDAVDDIGRVVIPSGAVVELMVTALTPAGDRRGSDATITLVITGVMVRGRHYPIAAGVKSMYHSLEGRHFLAGEQREALANSYGVVAGRVVGEDELGTVVGGVMRPAGGIVVAFQTAGRDVVVLAGTPIVLLLTAPLTVAGR
jgi:hypothetical protein